MLAGQSALLLHCLLCYYTFLFHSYFKFGSIGQIVGREYIRGFDNVGKLIFTKTLQAKSFLFNTLKVDVDACVHHSDYAHLQVLEQLPQSLYIGRLFNEVGNMEKWLSSESQAKFDTRAQCFIDQYNRLSIIVNYVSEN
jgi:hypothetical protein